jgi:Second Messenger Oligonucleotide or Dinucleotide Synthetase domain
MSVSNWFEEFNKNIRMSTETVNNISYRYKRITKQLNKDFYNSESELTHSLYVGSYGRGTDIVTSDIDMIFQLPYSTYTQYNAYTSNGQSALLQAVKTSIEKTYKSSMKADGQVIVISFTDNITFELVPAFLNNDDSFTFPDSNNGGSWKTTNPKPEIKEIREKNILWNKNLKRLCRMIRAWKYNCNVPIGGLLIDTLAYKFMTNYAYKDKSYLYYDFISRDFFKYLSEQNSEQNYWLSLGSNQYVWRKGNFEYKAKQAYNLSLEAITKEKDYPYTAKSKWREIYGTKFPS